ncbi:MAG TPA: hypothetical protein VMZ53_25025 [Kofleriaceae bacterium]|nr:hypothetical protein [Kofleriaceae bacterium]
MRGLAVLVLALGACGRLNFDDLRAGSGSDADSDGGAFVQSCFRAIASGNDFTCVIDARGDVWCWGSNRFFQSDPTQAGPEAILLPRKVSLPRPAVQLALGNSVACARLDDGHARCWGSDFWGSLGDGGGMTGPGPIEPAIGDTIVDIAAGGETVCALRSTDRRLLCWGKNTLFEAARPTGMSIDTPTLIDNTTGTKELALGHHHGCLIDASGVFKCWGRAGSSEIGDPTVDTPTPRTPPAYAAITHLVRGGGRFTCAIETSGDLRCVGNNNSLQLGRDDTYPSSTPLAPIVSGAASASLGSMSGCALFPDHHVECWGDGTDGLLGPTHLEPSATAVRVLDNVSALESGAHHACALRGPDVLCWGYNFLGELGRGDISVRASPTHVGSLPSATDLAVGPEHACMRSGLQLYCWGSNQQGQLGDGTRLSRPVAAAVDAGIAVDGVAVGAMNTCVWGGGIVRCAGRADSGQTGDTTYPPQSLAFRTVAGATAVSFVDIGTGQICGIDGGDVKCWGGNAYGELGTGDTMARATPTAIGLSNAIDVSAGTASTCAVAGGTLSCWGDNGHHQVSPLNTMRFLTPTAVNIGTDTPAQVSVGFTHACVLTTTGTIKCWGGNDAGEVGNNTIVDQLNPVDVSLPMAAAEVRAGSKLTCARLVDGTVYCWGLNEHGELGTGNFTWASVPIQVPNITDALAIEVGDGYACARHATGTIECWGNERRGRLGTGRLTLDATPTPVALSCMP